MLIENTGGVCLTRIDICFLIMGLEGVSDNVWGISNGKVLAFGGLEV